MRIVFGLAFVAFGASHFVYHEYVEAVIPVWIPFHKFFAYATGVAHIAAGATHSLGLRSNGTLVAWGSNVFGQCSAARLNSQTPQQYAAAEQLDDAVDAECFQQQTLGNPTEKK